MRGKMPASGFHLAFGQIGLLPYAQHYVRIGLPLSAAESAGCRRGWNALFRRSRP